MVENNTSRETIHEENDHGLNHESLSSVTSVARAQSTSLEEMRVLSEDPRVEVRIALAERDTLPGALEARLVKDPDAQVVRALVQNPHSSNFCIAHAPRWITWENNGRVYNKRGLPHYYWDMMILYLLGTGVVAMPLFSIMFHVIFGVTISPYIWILSLIMLGGLGALYMRRRRNYPKPDGWGAWDI